MFIPHILRVYSETILHDITSIFPHAEVYLVGGAVRDLLMKRDFVDCDYVVTGLSATEMQSLGWQGYGNSFFVYIHPQYGYEVALARTERKVGAGYTGFEVNADASITIEQDLQRRDLTINSIALRVRDWQLVDPYNGAGHIELKRFTPTSKSFMEDPIRSLRVARFAARFGQDWTIDDSIYQYTNTMITAGEFNTIHHNRVLLEIEKAFETDYPSIFFKTLDDLNLTQIMFNCTRYMDLSSIDTNCAIGYPWYVKYIAVHSCSAENIQSFGIDPNVLTKLVKDAAYRQVWYTSIEDIIDTIQRLSLFRNINILNTLVLIWAIRNPQDTDTLLCVKRSIEHVASLSFTDIFGQDANIEPTQRGAAVNAYRIQRITQSPVLLQLIGNI